MRLSAEKVVSNIKNILTFPGACIQLIDMLESDQCDAKELANIVALDPGLAGQLLRYANSPVFGYSKRVDTIERAIIVIGIKSLSDVLIAMSMLQTFSRPSGHELLSRILWRHSVMTACVAKVLASRCHVLHKERLFVAGLLHDLGLMAMVHNIPDDMDVHFAHQVKDESSIVHMIDSYMNCSHSEVGALLMEHWLLPEALKDVSQYHHTPHIAKSHNLEICIIHLADKIADFIDDREREDPNAPLSESLGGIDQYVWDVTGLGASELDDVVGIAISDFVANESLFMLR